MKILFICGSYPPIMCGVGDYTSKLIQMLNSKGVETSILTNIDWSIWNLRKIITFIIKTSPNLIHIQYPAVGFKASIVPQLLSLIFRKKTIVTIHEVSQANFIRKLSLILFSFSRGIILTNTYEKNYFSKYCLNSSNLHIIPIGSNIDKIATPENITRDSNTIVHFGQLRPKKGLEKVINLAEIIKKKKLNYKILIIGSVLDKFKNYFSQIKNLVLQLDLPIDWNINLESREISHILSSHSFCYLPFPDGASERRGSLLAAINHDMVVFTTVGPQTPSIIKNVVFTTNSEVDVLDIINKLQTNKEKLSLLNKNMNIYLDRYSWNSITDEHLNFYNSIIEK